ncbi:MAG TPA: hypothetical protein VF138_01555 [Caulobacteraceae bacterium]
MRAAFFALGTQIVAAISLVGCATPYQPPRTPPPAAWDGPFGFEPSGPPKIFTGVRRAGEPIASVPVRLVRTGLVAETVETRGAYGGPLILPKGAKAYATNYSLAGGYSARPMQGIDKLPDPIEWCVLLEAGKDGKQAESETVCLFYETPMRARYMETFDKGGFPIQPLIIGTSGVPGPIPTFEEQPVDFGPLRQELQIREIKNGRMELDIVLTDGKGRRIFDRQRTNGSAAFKWGGAALVLSPSGPDAVEVRGEAVAPP